MQRTAVATDEPRRRSGDAEGEKVFKGSEVFGDTSPNYLKTILALALWLGTIHFNVALVLFAIFFLSLHKALLLFGLLFVLMVIPVDEKSKFGRKLSRYICKHVCAYFPITLHVEDMKAFHPNRAYVFGYEPHSVLPIGVVALADNTVTRKRFTSLLDAGYSCILIPGGVQEAFLMEHGSEIDEEILEFVNRPKKLKVWKFHRGVLQLWILKGKFSCEGQDISPIPFKHPMHVVVGRPIELEKNHEPTPEEVARIHSQFVEALQDLFERHKARAGYPNLELRIV
ncbi:hypothetical protein JHK85_026249 [Glycine max]|nr:hypothetical protein JHK85_026249 [Glycine max]